MKLLAVALLLGLLLTTTIGVSGASAAAPESIKVMPGEGAELNTGPGDDQPPPQITIDTPQGILEPTL